MTEPLPAFLDTAPCGILMLSEAGNIVTANATLADLVGCAPETLKGKALATLLGPGGRVFVETHLFPLLRLQGRAEEIYLSLRTCAARDMPVLFSATRRVRGDEIFTDCVLLPMERRYRFEEGLVKAKKMSREANQFLEAQVAARTAEIRELATDLNLAEYHEREALAHTLHDTVQQEFYAMQFSLVKLRNAVADEAALEHVAELEALLKGAMQITRDLTVDLRPAVLMDSDFNEALVWLCRTMRAKHGLSVTLETAGRCRIESEAARALLFNVARELLFNVVKHAGIDEAGLTLVERGLRIELSVEDAGEGFTPSQVAEPDRGTGLGLSGIHKRLQLFGGSLDVKAAPGKGTRVRVSLPVGAHAEGET